jgi:hypothetical protein
VDLTSFKIDIDLTIMRLNYAIDMKFFNYVTSIYETSTVLRFKMKFFKNVTYVPSSA